MDTVYNNKYIFPILKRGDNFIDYNGKIITQEDMLYFLNAYELLYTSINSLGEQAAKHINMIEELHQEIDMKTDALQLVINCLKTRKEDMFLMSISDACRFALELGNHKEGDDE